MAKIRVQVVLARASGLPEDVIVNTMHFEDDEPSVGEVTGVSGTTNLDGLVARLKAFYVTIGPNILSPFLTGFALIKIYDMSAPEPRAPKAEVPFQFFPNTSGVPYPAEVALCLSFKAQGLSGAAAGRRRGRIFLGPIAGPTGAQQVDDMRPTEAKVDLVLQAAENMSRGGGGSYRLAIFSPTAAAGNDTLDAAWNDADEFWIDNAFDTMRSRGADRTSRRRLIIGQEAVLAA